MFASSCSNVGLRHFPRDELIVSSEIDDGEMLNPLIRWQWTG